MININEHYHHAYIIECLDYNLALEHAKKMIQAISCNVEARTGCGKCENCTSVENLNHVDIYYVEADKKTSGSGKKSVRNEHITDLIRFLGKTPLNGNHNFGIINNADDMTSESFNRLLKTLEEPSEGTVIFLLSMRVDSLPATIRSRAVIERVYRDNALISQEAGEISKELFEAILNRKYLYELFEIINKVGKDRNLAAEVIDGLEISFYKLLKEGAGRQINISKHKIFDAVNLCEKSRREIKKNIIVAYSLKKLVLEIRR